PSSGASELRDEQLAPAFLVRARDANVAEARVAGELRELVVAVEVAARRERVRCGGRPLRLGRGCEDREPATPGIEDPPHLLQRANRLREEEERDERGD